ncbi:MAG TPA: HDIG domain-containing protein [Bacteroidia bacterium]|nr:HDIG domain-containing protein [Bacteroidia bacterium]
MSRLTSFFRDRHSHIYKGFVFAASVALIVFLLPKEGKFKYDLSNIHNKPWHYDDLIAPFDFAIKKSAPDLETERAEVGKKFKPYFRVEQEVVNRMKEKYAAEVNGHELFKPVKGKSNPQEENRRANYQMGLDLLDTVYRHGIVELNPVIEGKPEDFTILVKDGSQAREKELRQLFTVRTSDEFLKQASLSFKGGAGPLLLPVLENCLAHNVVYDEVTSTKELDQMKENISLTRGGKYRDQSIISRGDMVDDEKFLILKSLQEEFELKSKENTSYIFVTIGQLTLVCLCFLILFLFLKLFRPEILASDTQVTFLMIMVDLFILLSYLPSEFSKIPMQVLPFCMLPLVIRSFYDSRLALFAHLVAVLITAQHVPDRFEFVFLQLIAGIVAIFSMVNLRNRSQIFISSGVIFLSYAAAYFGLSMLHENSITAIDWGVLTWYGGSALLVLFTYPFIFACEKIFGFVSDVTLLELADTNSPLLRELATKAPGTFQHALQVANLAEETVRKIGGNALLVRTGALYHDIGKGDMPMYFTENQLTGVNPHDELSYDESAGIIISHVIRGVEKAKKYKIPDVVTDFIRTHHGTTATGYFLTLYKKSHTGPIPDDSKFRYPGPTPYSKETAVLMMADAVEAASRSLGKYDEDSIQNLIDKIIDKQIEEKQFVNTPITFRDISQAKKILKKKLMSIYHVRVAYPS